MKYLKKIVRSIFLFFQIFLFSFIISAQKETTINLNRLDNSTIDPNNSLIEAEIIEILPAKKKRSQKLCNKFPCKAIVGINKVVGYGSSFPVIFDKGIEIKVFFAHSLEPSKKVLPNLKYDLPGLLIGDKFKAKIEGIEKMGGSIKYIVYYYEVL
ncbi:MAG: hypothetical protein DRI95_05070 [Bacteroidetes bacterium]|nr:MAG: hypothetical protein DRI95_05070 [Bacteroidota bacterium]